MIERITEIQIPTVKAGFDMIYLVTCVLQDIVPKQGQVEQMDLTLLYRVATNHSLTAMVCMALESADAFTACQDIQLVKRWKDAKEKAIRKNLMFDAERNEILGFMEREGIWYMPLKGVLLKELYPKLGMRQMSDNDVLYDSRYQKKILSYMVTRGYKAFQFGKGNHDVYQKLPIYNFEFHTALFGTEHDTNWESYYRNVKQRLMKDEGNRFGYHFKNEDFYIYMMTHTFKHYKYSGTGIRSLLDNYVFLQHKDNLN